jgi:hypothetical protein
MHARREIDHILDNINEIIAKNKTSNKESEDDRAMLEHLYATINLKTNNGRLFGDCQELISITATLFKNLYN